ncbi:MAG: aminotransferase class I/II-fold pyridoxal phosphate-dependent enzyme [Planctomycetes bacterium]|nr:aminotransferase class I/II-fold pyridoxal phosphate-dependent enzyme [Planctomycetota bacterium]
MAGVQRSRAVPDASAGIPLPPAHVDLRLDGNEGRPPGPGFFAALHDPELLRSYPLDRSLEAALAARHSVSEPRVVCGAGSDDLTDRLCRAVLEPGRGAVVPVPTFEMLGRHAAAAGATVREVPWLEGPFPRAEVLARIGADTGLVAIVSPNNPTGLVATAEDVRAVCAAAPHAAVLVDAAYAEFGGEDLTAAALPFPNAVVLRTFSKAFGLAGLRVGYAIADPPVASWLRAVGAAFPCGTLSRRAALHRLGSGGEEVAGYVVHVRAERERYRERLLAAGFQAAPSAGNFVFARGPHCEWLRDALLGLGIAVRCLHGGVRVTMPGSEAEFARLLRATSAALAPDALLFDLDGVLADVAGRRPLAEPAALAQLAAHRPLGVVTGCPRRLAESVLARHGLRGHVAALVCAEDGPGKPDPAPVRACLQRLGAASAWFLGDNPGDVLAARGAGAVPLAVAPHGIGAEGHARRLREVGAARLVDGFGGLQSLHSTVTVR